MKNITVLLILFLVGCCGSGLNNLQYKNFNTSTLALMQDRVFNKLSNSDTISNDEINRLKNNCWVRWAEKLAPNNLVVRNLCLLDIIENDTKRIKRIYSQVESLVYYDKTFHYIWAEGYSYWLYTKPILKMYSNRFDVEYIKSLIENVDENFQKSAYIRDGVLYPAPYGDLRNEPLEDTLQNINKVETNVILTHIVKIDSIYRIAAWEVGLNTHITKKPMSIKIIDGHPHIMKNDSLFEYEWYSGYNKKYKCKIDEITDVLDRIEK
ncbi:MAG: hypothetical protein ACOC2U_04510 [bacterium]